MVNLIVNLFNVALDLELLSSSYTIIKQSIQALQPWDAYRGGWQIKGKKKKQPHSPSPWICTEGITCVHCEIFPHLVCVSANTMAQNKMWWPRPGKQYDRFYLHQIICVGAIILKETSPLWIGMIYNCIPDAIKKNCPPQFISNARSLPCRHQRLPHPLFFFHLSVCGHNASFLLSTSIKIQTQQSFIYNDRPVSYLLYKFINLLMLQDVQLLFLFLSFVPVFFFPVLTIKTSIKSRHMGFVFYSSDKLFFFFFLSFFFCLFVWHWSWKHEIPPMPCLPDKLLLKCLIQLICRKYTVITQLKHQF